MKSSREIEIKLKVEDPRGLKRRLKECGFKVIGPRRFESNIVFDFEDSRLRRSCSLLRLRTEGSRCLLTYKGPPQGSGSYKIRTEIETAVEDESATLHILEALGLRPSFRYEKFRTTYAERKLRGSRDQPHLLYDETPIGHYIELEGRPRWIDQVARRLGYQKRDYITASYAALYHDHCLRNAIKKGHMLFFKNNS